MENNEAEVIELMGAVNVKQNEAPFSVELYYAKNGYEAHCAGTMITDRHVLTAAHCFVRKNCDLGYVSEMLNSKGWKVFYGGGCLPFAKDACSDFQKIARSADVKNIAIPNDFLAGPCLHSDIAIATVKQKMATMDEVACVAQPGDEIPEIFTLYARGSDPNKAKKVTSLAKVNLKRIECPPEELSGTVGDQLCTSELSDMNICSGDSGSGLMYKSRNRTWVVTGVTSAGTDCEIIKMKNDWEKGIM